MAERREYDEEYLEPKATGQDGTTCSVSVTDAVFGDITGGGPNYRDVCSLMDEHNDTEC